MQLSKNGNSNGKTVIGVDNFSGLKSAVISDADTSQMRSKKTISTKFLNSERIEHGLRNICAKLNLNCTIIKGDFSDVLEEIVADKRFSFIHLDCDLYESYRKCLEIIYPKVNKGGMIVFDEYNSKYWPGAKVAINDFFKGKPEKPVPYSASRHSTYYTIKQ